LWNGKLLKKNSKAFYIAPIQLIASQVLVPHRYLAFILSLWALVLLFAIACIFYEIKATFIQLLLVEHSVFFEKCFNRETPISSISVMWDP